jgi:hypothetical protein
LERYSKIIHVKDFAPQIDESIKAFFSGYKIVAVVALVPVVEGIVRKMATRQDRDIGKGTKKLKEEFALLVERERASPHCYGERLVMLEVLRDFISERFLKETSSYDGLNNFNRHGIVHAIYDQYGDDLNFFRLITLRPFVLRDWYDRRGSFVLCSRNDPGLGAIGTTLSVASKESRLRSPEGVFVRSFVGCVASQSTRETIAIQRCGFFLSGHVLTKSRFTVFSQLRLLPRL